MLKNGIECCDECEAPLPGGTGRSLDDEVLCERCYETRSKSFRWLATTVVADGVLIVLAVISFVMICQIPVTGRIKMLIFIGPVAALFFARPHVLAIVKDIIMHRKQR